MAPKSRPEKKSVWRNNRLLQCVLVLAAVAAFLGGIIWAGRWGLEQLQGQQRYEVPLANIEFDPPAGMSRSEFLSEVRYLSPQLPDRLNVADSDLDSKLRDAFAKHAWVEKVEVEIKPPKQIIVNLTLRIPVLAVKVGKDVRAVDGNGVLLPRNASIKNLPVYDGDARPPRNEAGKRWGDPNVEAAARKLKKQ